LDDSGTIADSEALYPWIHFGLTSEDVNNLAQRLLVKQAVSEAIVPAIREVRDALVDLAQEHRGTPMLAHTHGQPATPTTFGKEMAVYASRLGRARPSRRRERRPLRQTRRRLGHLRRPRRGLPRCRLAGVRRVVRARA